MGSLTTIIMLVVSLWEGRLLRKRRTSRIAIGSALRWGGVGVLVGGETRKPSKDCLCFPIRLAHPHVRASSSSLHMPLTSDRSAMVAVFSDLVSLTPVKRFSRHRGVGVQTFDARVLDVTAAKGVSPVPPFARSPLCGNGGGRVSTTFSCADHAP